MDFAPDLILIKTAKGNDEIVSRRHNLNPRLRQVLILIDGRRPFSDLSRMVGEKELVAYAMALESEGFIDRKSEPSGTSHSQAAVSSSRNLNSGESQSDVFADASAVEVLEKPAAPADFITSRRAVARALNDSLGPFAEEISMRIEKAKSIQELRELLPSAASVVEAVRGKTAMTEFINRVGKL
jgi:hypothetical protein